MKCKYRVRWFYSKGALLVLFWILIITFVITSMFTVFPSPSTTLTNNLYTWVYGVLLILSLLVGPLAGWLADAKFGNYKVVRFGVWLLFLATVLNCFYYLIADNTLVLILFLFVIYTLLQDVLVPFWYCFNWVWISCLMLQAPALAVISLGLLVVVYWEHIFESCMGYHTKSLDSSHQYSKIDVIILPYNVSKENSNLISYIAVSRSGSRKNERGG